MLGIHELNGKPNDAMTARPLCPNCGRPMHVSRTTKEAGALPLLSYLLDDCWSQMVHRGDHEAHQPKAGDLWPPDGHEHVTSGVQTGALRKKV